MYAKSGNDITLYGKENKTSKRSEIPDTRPDHGNRAFCMNCDRDGH